VEVCLAQGNSLALAALVHQRLPCVPSSPQRAAPVLLTSDSATHGGGTVASEQQALDWMTGWVYRVRRRPHAFGWSDTVRVCAGGAASWSRVRRVGAVV
jgi:hypothetical protein